MARLQVKELQRIIGADDDGDFGPLSRNAMTAYFTNKKAPALTLADFAEAALDLDVPIEHIRAIRKVEAPRGPYDDNGLPSILYERHVFSRNTLPVRKFDKKYPKISGDRYGAGGYGAYSAQWGKLLDACALDPEAAFRACSWGAFQVLGENAQFIGYDSAFQMAYSMTKGEAAHLRAVVRFIKTNKLQGKLRACEANKPDTCIPFVRAYNGVGFREFGYHTKFANALR